MADTEGRTRIWSFICYPESAPINWESYFNRQHLEWAHSPCHDADTNPDGECKKEHWHCIIKFAGKKSYNQLLEIIDVLNSEYKCCTIPQPVKSEKGMLRYFVHLDNPEKAQYSKDDIVYFGGYDEEAIGKLTSTEARYYMNEAQQYIDDHNIYYFDEFCKIAASDHYDTWYYLACSPAYSSIINYYLSAKRSKAFKGRCKPSD